MGQNSNFFVHLVQGKTHQLAMIHAINLYYYCSFYHYAS